jgi:site-specific DNA-cytosine methylase
MGKIKFIDLFAGTGAFSLALEENDKFECVFANDIMECSEKMYKLNHLETKFVLGI